MKQKIKIFFTDFWPVFKIEDNYFLDLLKDDYEVEITDLNPDLIFFSVFGTDFNKFRCKRIFFTGENVRPNFNQCDRAFSFDYSDDKRNFRLPLYALFADVEQLTLPKPPINQLLKEKTRFCNFIYSNPSCKKRNEFFKKLNKYKKVDSAGRLYRNMAERVKDKIEFVRQYKFTIAFENESFPGYTTEKIMEPMLVHSIPIYWGNPLVDRDFNQKSFLNYHSFESDEALIEKIIEIDKNDDLFIQMLNEPFFENNVVNQYVDKSNIKKGLKEIIDSEITPIAQELPDYYFEEPVHSLRIKALRTNYKLNHNLKKIKSFSIQKLKIKIDKMRGK